MNRLFSVRLENSPTLTGRTGGLSAREPEGRRVDERPRTAACRSRAAGASVNQQTLPIWWAIRFAARSSWSTAAPFLLLIYTAGGGAVKKFKRRRKRADDRRAGCDFMIQCGLSP